MKAGYLVGKWVQNKLKSWSQQSVINYLAASVGKTAAKKIVSRVVAVGATAAATYIAGLLGASGTVAGPIGVIVGAATGWL
ncbi:hypothetical protein [Metabacillus malikii]|uniref:Uncharacterized protein n=1 Tax=Metabacillus malikii TaxID=1504265 RepID=A0ABT9ZIE0_9BACI|nr:hypothetical protein [Metabacillus malikii]MDQ0231664.1 hypothetical protein [Metabacillus malikii]